MSGERLAICPSQRLAQAGSGRRRRMSKRSLQPSGIVLAVVDSGPLYAVTDIDDDGHLASLEVLGRTDLELVVPALVVAEVTYLVGRRLGASAEARFLDGLGAVDVEAPSVEDWHRMAQLVDEYADFPISGTDASVVALAERLDTDVVITFDRRHFAAVKPRHRPAFRVLPE
jgi:uncharacterized protein